MRHTKVKNMTSKGLVWRAGRFWSYLNQGLGNYAGTLVSLLSSLLIIYNFLVIKYTGNNPILFPALLVFVVLISFLIGWVAKKSGFWYASNELNVEINPWIDHILGKKERMSYELMLKNYEIQQDSLESMANMPGVTEAQKKKLAQDVREIEKMRNRVQELLNQNNEQTH